MSTVELTNSVNTIAVDTVVTRTWAIPSSGQIGSATFTIPRNSPAWSSLYIDPDGGSAVRVAGQNGCGDWLGIVTQPKATETGLQITAYQPWAILSHRYVRSGRTYRHVTPGFLFTQAWRDGVGGINTLVSVNEPYEVGGPHVPSFQFSGQDVWGAITSLMQLSEHELHIDATTLHADWCGSYAYATRYPTLLVGGGNLRNASYTTDGTSRAAEVIALDPDNKPPYRTRAGDVAAQQNWPAQAQVAPQVGGALLRSAADTELARRSAPLVTVEGDVTGANWDIRERQNVQVLIPWARFSGALVTCRVLSRAVTDGSSTMHLVLQVLNAPRVSPPLIASASGGASGNVARRIRQMGRDTLQHNRERLVRQRDRQISTVMDTTGGTVDGTLAPIGSRLPAGLVDNTGGNVVGNVGAMSGTVPGALTDSTTGSAGGTVANVGGAFNQTTLNDNFATLTAQITALGTASTSDQATLNDNHAALTARVNQLREAHAADQALLNDNLAELAAEIGELRSEINRLRGSNG